MPQPRIVVCINRPGMRLSQGRRPSNISSLSRVRNRISPIQMNKGRAASSQLALLSQNAENRFLPGWVWMKNAWPTQPQIASVIAIHKPDANSTSIRPSSTAPTTSMLSMAMRLDLGRVVAGGVPLLDGHHVGGPTAAQHDDELVEHSHQQQDRTEREAQLWYPHRHRQQAGGDVVELPALVGKAIGPVREVGGGGAA